MLFTQKNIEQLCVPLSETSACGVYLKLDKSAFRPLRNEFNVAQTALRKLSQNPSEDEKEDIQDTCTESWKVLSSSLFELFSTKTRDIELISWFLASQVLLDPSLDSTANTLEWLADLSDQHWDDLNPVLPVEKLKTDDAQSQQKEQAEAKIKSLIQLVGDSVESSILYAPLLQFTLVGHVSYFDYHSAERKGEVSQLKSSLTTVVVQERAAIQAKMENLARCLLQVERLSSVVATKVQAFGIHSANFGFIKSLFTGLESALVHLSGLKVAVQKDVQPEVSEMADQNTDLEESLTLSENPVSSSVQSSSSGSSQYLNSDNLSELGSLNNMNRDLAFHLLREVSDYFRQSEPHSPISFLLEKAIRWGYLPLPELLEEMMHEQSSESISSIFNATGLNHLDQVVLPDVDGARSDMKKMSKPQKAPTILEPSNTDAPVSQASPVDAQLESSEVTNSLVSSGLSW